MGEIQNQINNSLTEDYDFVTSINIIRKIDDHVQLYRGMSCRFYFCQIDRFENIEEIPQSIIKTKGENIREQNRFLDVQNAYYNSVVCEYSSFLKHFSLNGSEFLSFGSNYSGIILFNKCNSEFNKDTLSSKITLTNCYAIFKNCNITNIFDLIDNCKIEIINCTGNFKCNTITNSELYISNSFISNINNIDKSEVTIYNNNCDVDVSTCTNSEFNVKFDYSIKFTTFENSSIYTQKIKKSEFTSVNHSNINCQTNNKLTINSLSNSHCLVNNTPTVEIKVKDNNNLIIINSSQCDLNYNSTKTNTHLICSSGNIIGNISHSNILSDNFTKITVSLTENSDSIIKLFNGNEISGSIDVQNKSGLILRNISNGNCQFNINDSLYKSFNIHSINSILSSSSRIYVSNSTFVENVSITKSYLSLLNNEKVTNLSSTNSTVEIKNTNIQSLSSNNDYSMNIQNCENDLNYFINLDYGELYRFNTIELNLTQVKTFKLSNTNANVYNIDNSQNVNISGINTQISEINITDSIDITMYPVNDCKQNITNSVVKLIDFI